MVTEILVSQLQCILWSKLGKDIDKFDPLKYEALAKCLLPSVLKAMSKQAALYRCVTKKGLHCCFRNDVHVFIFCTSDIRSSNLKGIFNSLGHAFYLIIRAGSFITLSASLECCSFIYVVTYN